MRPVVVFDFDGTLYRLPVDWTKVRAGFGLAPTDSLTDFLNTELDAGEQARTDAVLTALTEHERAAVGHGEFLPGALDALTELAGHADLAVLTRNSRHCVTDALADTGHAGIFVIGREDVRRLKPDPEGVHAVLAHFGGDPARALLVGDTFHDVGAANAAGVTSVVVRNDELTYAPQGADEYVDTMTGALGVIKDRIGAELR